MNKLNASLFLLALLAFSPAPSETSGFARAVAGAERALEKGDLLRAEEHILRALERDSKAVVAWELYARWAEASEDADRQVYALHQILSLRSSQGASKSDLEPLRDNLRTLDPQAEKLFTLRSRTIAKLVPVAEQYAKDGRPHSAIRVHKEILALDPENEASRAAIEELASAPDPSLAEEAKPADPLAGVSNEWILEHDAEHADWKERAKLERDNYVTHTNAGYEVLVLAAEAMEQMNAFYRVFFQHGTEESGGSVPRIDLRIFQTKEEYLEYGSSPVEWSGGQFTGSAVETYVGSGGFESMMGTLFHEAAHQFVSLATNASGWLNEGLASFFEGTRMLANGSVLMNLPANHRLFPTVARMETGWMADASDGLDPENPSTVSPRAPSFRLILENEYEWGPAWYGPTWAVVYFAYNFQDPLDGRYVYRQAFREYIDKSGGRVGKGAVSTFEEVVLQNPAPPTKGIKSEIELPQTVDELNEVWKDWLVKLRDEQSGQREVVRPYRDWAGYAVTRGDLDDAEELFEKGLRERPDDARLLKEFADLLVARENEDRATKLLRRAAQILEREDPVDEVLLMDVDRALRKIDPQHFTLEKVREELVMEANELVDGYLEGRLERMAMEVALSMGQRFDIPELFDKYEKAAWAEGESLSLWQLAYNEEDLRGWSAGGQSIFSADGESLAAKFGEPQEGEFAYRFLSLDTVTSGDFSIEAEIQAEYGQVTYAGLVFGKKSDQDFHAAILFPPKPARNGYVDLASFYGGGKPKTWRHSPFQPTETAEGSKSATWVRLRLDVTGRAADVWVDDTFVTTQEFPSLDVLRGSFGLIVGAGETRYRNVRYLAREPGDPTGAIERELRIAGANGGTEAGTPGEAAGSAEAAAKARPRADGSWDGQIPPFPTVAKWLQGSRESWEEFRGSPQLLVLWSRDQNETIRLDEWLNVVQRRGESVGLQILSIVSCWDEPRFPLYLETNPFPGAVGLDTQKGTQSNGVTFEDYSIEKFQLPRLLLLDVDGRVVWEGDPGFAAGKDWKRGDDSLLDDPLDFLIDKRKLKRVGEWRERWQAAGPEALDRAALEPILPLMREAEAFDADVFPTVAAALRPLQDIRQALEELDGTAASLAENGRTPALNALLDWGQLLEIRTAPGKETKKLLKGDDVKAWTRAMGMLKPLLRKVDAGRDPGSADAVVERMQTLEGVFVEELRAQLAAAADAAALSEVVRSASALPARWLAKEHFGWSGE